MKFSNLKENTKEAIKVLTISGILIVLFYLLVHNMGGILHFIGKALGVLSSFIIGIFITLVLSPLRQWLEEKWLSKTKLKPSVQRVIAVIICIALLLILISAFFLILIPQLIDSMATLIGSMDSYVNTVREFIDRMLANNEQVSDALNNMLDLMGDSISDWLTSAVGGFRTLVNYSISFVKGIINILIGIVVSIYILLDEENFQRQVKSLLYAILPPARAQKTYRLIRTTWKTFKSYFVGKFVDSLVVAIITYIVMAIMKMPYAPLIAVVVGTTNMIPVVGPFIGAIPCGIILLIISPLRALEFLIYDIILQQIDGNILGPIILGESVGLSAIWILFAITVFGALFGILGMFIGVPIFSVIYVTIQQFIQDSLASRNIDIDNTQELHNI